MNNKIFFSLTIFVFSSVMASEKKDILAQVCKNNVDARDYKVSKTFSRLSGFPISELDDIIPVDEIREFQLIVNPNNITIQGNSKELRRLPNGQFLKSEYRVEFKDESLVALKSALKEISRAKHPGFTHRMIDNSRMMTPKYVLKFAPNIDVTNAEAITQSVLQSRSFDGASFNVVLTKQQAQHIMGEKSYMPYTETIIIFCSAGFMAALMYYFNLHSKCMTLLQRS